MKPVCCHTHKHPHAAGAPSSRRATHGLTPLLIAVVLPLLPLVSQGQQAAGGAGGVTIEALTEFDRDDGSWESDLDSERDAGWDTGDAAEPAAPEKPRIAVYAFKIRGNLGIPDAGAIIAEWMISALEATNRFTLMERVLLQQVIEEQELQTSYLADESTLAAEAGRLYGVEAVVSGTVLQWGETISIVARLVDTSTGIIREAAEVKTRNRQDIPDEIALLARKLAGPAPAPVPAPASATQPVTVATTTAATTAATAVTRRTPIEQNPARLAITVLPHPHLRLGEEMRIRITSQAPGYLTVIDINALGEVAQVYPLGPAPPADGASGQIRAGGSIVIPDPYSGLRFTAAEPSGRGHLVAVLSTLPVDPDTLTAAQVAWPHAGPSTGPAAGSAAGPVIGQAQADAVDVDRILARLQQSLDEQHAARPWSMSVADYLIEY
ncbi:DUF4384 domain-containing protein [Thiohalocapsa marina]|uniref:DUF4384 domain-containing protein n=1 Tax=Thiohalocapsa marina TaxID=424902 RepID=A0A5M8FLU4_9GAMM|nr:DUF4384 domain-containing protein [Thiohalocapsa marina]KAA6184091.1 DUF4384 domain-containing protein [Thiohalocapsa marina]